MSGELGPRVSAAASQGQPQHAAGATGTAAPGTLNLNQLLMRRLLLLRQHSKHQQDQAAAASSPRVHGAGGSCQPTAAATMSPGEDAGDADPMCIDPPLHHQLSRSSQPCAAHAPTTNSAGAAREEAGNGSGSGAARGRLLLFRPQAPLQASSSVLAEGWPRQRPAGALRAPAAGAGRLAARRHSHPEALKPKNSTSTPRASAAAARDAQALLKPRTQLFKWRGTPAAALTATAAAAALSAASSESKQQQQPQQEQQQQPGNAVPSSPPHSLFRQQPPPPLPPPQQQQRAIDEGEAERVEEQSEADEEVMQQAQPLPSSWAGPCRSHSTLSTLLSAGTGAAAGRFAPLSSQEAPASPSASTATHSSGVPALLLPAAAACSYEPQQAATGAAASQTSLEGEQDLEQLEQQHQQALQALVKRLLAIKLRKHRLDMVQQKSHRQLGVLQHLLQPNPFAGSSDTSSTINSSGSSSSQCAPGSLFVASGGSITSLLTARQQQQQPMEAPAVAAPAAAAAAAARPQPFLTAAQILKLLQPPLAASAAVGTGQQQQQQQQQRQPSLSAAVAARLALHQGMQRAAAAAPGAAGTGGGGADGSATKPQPPSDSSSSLDLDTLASAAVQALAST